MKKILVTAVTALFLTGCAAKYSLRHEFPKTYEYDRLYSAAMLALNDSNFGLTEHNKADGVIAGQDLKDSYFDLNAGVFIVLPWVGAAGRHPLISVVLVKAQEKILMSAAEITSGSLKNTLPDFLDRIEYFYSRFDGKETAVPPGSAPAARPGTPVQDRETAIVAPAKKMQANVNWDNSVGLSLRNTGKDDWKDLAITVEYGSILETKVYTYKAVSLKAGELLTIKKSLFRSEDNGEIKRNDMPKISLQCGFEDGTEGGFSN